MTKPDYTNLDLPSAPKDRPYVLVNMVMSADGKVVIEGTEQGIGTKVDQRLMRELRVSADVVFDGAGTVRASGASSRLGSEELEQIRLVRGKSRYPIAATLTRSGNIPADGAFLTGTDFEAVVYASSAMAPARREALAASGRMVVDVPEGQEAAAMLRHMRDALDARVLLVEGGPTVNAELFRLGAVDEFFVTIGPVIVGGRDTLTPVEGARGYSREMVRKLEQVSVFPNPETNEIYARYRVHYPSS